MSQILFSIDNINFSINGKPLAKIFSDIIYTGEKVALVGNNGSGKSTLIKILAGELALEEGVINHYKHQTIRYIPQIITEFPMLSGGQKFQKLLSKAISDHPDLLLLDEPTNHLDPENRNSLIRYLRDFRGTLIFASHDTELLQQIPERIWHLKSGLIEKSRTSYNDFLHEQNLIHKGKTDKIKKLHKDVGLLHEKLMFEQTRASNRKRQGEKKYGHDKLALQAARQKGENSSSRIQRLISQNKKVLQSELSQIRPDEKISPKFYFDCAARDGKVLAEFSNASLLYQSKAAVLKNFSLLIRSDNRIAVTGKNGSGKSTLLKALARDPEIIVSGYFFCRNSAEIALLDQHYANLLPEKTVTEMLSDNAPGWSSQAIRTHLNRYLFRTDAEVNKKTKHLSGGEKARLALALISAKSPRLLLLDEITNNMDCATREHVIETLNLYPGAFVLVSHDEDFLSRVKITHYLKLDNPIGRA